MNQITHNVNDIAIGQRPSDGYINLTAMAQANGKLIADYLRLETTKAFAEELSKTMRIPIVNLIQVKAGRNGGTWGHPQVAIHCAQWCSAQFAVLVSKWVYDWMREGKTPIVTQLVPSQRERLETIHLGIRLFQELGGCDPRTELMLKDHIRNILLEEKRKPAPRSFLDKAGHPLPTQTICDAPPTTQRGCPALSGENVTLPGRVEWPISDRAVVLGHRPTPAQLRKIGKEAARLYQERHGQKPVQREQFVGGATRMVNAYSEADVDILDSVIALVMEAGVTNNLDKAGHPL